ncbi:MAG: bifunctional riboflavin kinase/FAD synthetase [Rhodocyclaceae bacterium]|jgi:riboflavin kinase/FMN adenylyltransferase|nr:bifunctional riboflavin kinase/FAD synthetase [Rhodocyclaceae bacterium]MBK6907948.1 bifunctional riboflavin kinase/FAD synthetase [Rhodocyclaceae bacterium]
MQVYRGVPHPGGSRALPPTALTIGNFDGVHYGHQAVLQRLTGEARERQLPATVLTFEPHPREYFAPDQAPARLSSLREKLARLEICGVDRVHVCRFNRPLASLTADDFVRNILVEGLQTRHLLIGDDFRFGKGRAGDLSHLTLAGKEHGFSVAAMHTVDCQGERVSSSAVRAALAAGDLEHAARLLGHPYAIAGRVMHGNKIGRTLGFPTANISLRRKQLPLVGVYAVTVEGAHAYPQVGAGETAKCAALNGKLRGAASIGFRPTIGEGLKPVLEVYLLDFSGDIYGAHLSVNFLHKLRDEAKYESLDALKDQIARDVADVRAYFESTAHG